MGYENAPGTAMLASHCACCGRPLLDATSVECGVGPDCREKHGFDIQVDEAARLEANKIVHAIAIEQTGAAVAIGVVALHKLGFVRLAERIAKRIGAVQIEVDGTSLLVRAPYNEAHVARMRNVPGRRWDRERKCDRVPNDADARAFLWGALRASFAGQVGFGPQGAFVIA